MEKVILLLLDKNEFIFQIVTIKNNIPKLQKIERIELSSRFKTDLPEPEQIILAYASLASSSYVSQLSEWRVCSRNIPSKIIKIVSLATDLKIETLTKTREQELLLKGLGYEANDNPSI